MIGHLVGYVPVMTLVQACYLNKRELLFTLSLVKSCEGSALLQSNPLMHCASAGPDEIPPSTLLSVPPVRSYEVRASRYV